LNEYEAALLNLSNKIPPEDTYPLLLGICAVMDRIADNLYEDNPQALIDLLEEPDIRTYFEIARDINIDILKNC
jgi:hypothetical protein